LVALGMGLPKALTFVAAMLVGMLLFDRVFARRASAAELEERVPTAP